jgi:hypothetical protein
MVGPTQVIDGPLAGDGEHPGLEAAVGSKRSRLCHGWKKTRCSTSSASS